MVEHKEGDIFASQDNRGTRFVGPQQITTGISINSGLGLYEKIGGRFITTTDVGTTSRDMEYIHQETNHVVGLPVTAGGSGDTSIMTGLGIYMAMKSCAREVWGSDSLQGRKVVMQGFGKVATHMAHHLLKEDAQLVVTDVYEDALDQARDLGLKVVSPQKIYDLYGSFSR